MENKAENVVQNVGVLAETTSIFYNSISKQVPKDVALVLTQHFMDLTIARRNNTQNLAAAAVAAVQAAEAQRRALEHQKRQRAAQGEKTPLEQPAPETREEQPQQPEKAQPEAGETN